MGEDMNRQMIKAELLDRGFKVITTGGNCEAFQIFYDDDELYEILITQECSLPVDDQDITIALYDTVNGDIISQFEGSFNNIIHWYEFTVKEIIAESEEENLFDGRA